jgi:hypothetical protein
VFCYRQGYNPVKMNQDDLFVWGMGAAGIALIGPSISVFISFW